MIDYSPLWQTMRERGVSQYRLLKLGIDNRLLDSLRKGKSITLYTLERLCKILDCTPNDVVRFIDDKSGGRIRARPSLCRYRQKSYDNEPVISPNFAGTGKIRVFSHRDFHLFLPIKPIRFIPV